jgi:Na+/melibiose symporter-like transporter
MGPAAMLTDLVLPQVHLRTRRSATGQEGSGIHEDTLDSLHMIFRNTHLAIVIVVQMFALLAYNYMGMHVTGLLGAVFRTVLETMRTLFVWLLGLALFYFGTGLGEQWDKWSFVQAAGFAVLVTGTIVYGRGDEHEAAKVRAYQHPSVSAKLAGS